MRQNTLHCERCLREAVKFSGAVAALLVVAVFCCVGWLYNRGAFAASRVERNANLRSGSSTDVYLSVPNSGDHEIQIWYPRSASDDVAKAVSEIFGTVTLLNAGAPVQRDALRRARHLRRLARKRTVRSRAALHGDRHVSRVATRLLQRAFRCTRAPRGCTPVRPDSPSRSRSGRIDRASDRNGGRRAGTAYHRRIARRCRSRVGMSACPFGRGPSAGRIRSPPSLPF